MTQELDWLLIGTGRSLSAPFIITETAFYGFFSPWPVPPLGPEDGATLLDGLVPPAAATDSAWPARRDALVLLAGGSPRALVAMGLSVRRNPEHCASEHLEAVARRFTPHFRHRFRALSPGAQNVLELLAQAPYELGPSDVAERLSIDPRVASTTLRRMVDDGVLVVRREGRRSWFSVAEPLFRFWTESRAGPWRQTRVGALTRWIEAVSTLNGALGASGTRLEPLLRFDPVGAERALARQIDDAGTSALHPEVQRLVELLRPATG